MRILIVNDDGVNASQLVPLIRYCQVLGEVTTVVPKFEQSGKSHALELHQPYEIKQVALEPGITVYTVDSTPADCVRYAVLGLKEQYDLVVSGINRGLNLGRDIMYSGTVGAVSEAVSLGLKAIALSTSVPNYGSAVEALPGIFAYIRKHGLLETHDLYNINIPAEPKGIRITRQGGHYFSDDFIHLGDDMYKVSGKCVYQDSNDLTLDSDAVSAGYISIMPLNIDRTDMYVFQKLLASCVEE